MIVMTLTGDLGQNILHIGYVIRCQFRVERGTQSNE